MPVLIKDHSWRQTNDMVVVRVPLRNIPHTKVDLFHSDIYIKVHFPPFLFECCLYEPINEDESKCTLVRGEAVFELAKVEKNEWPTLQKDLTKQEMVQIKKEAIEHAQTRAAELKDKKQVLMRQRRDDCVGQQISLDEKGRCTIKDKKSAEKINAFNEIMEWKEKDTDKNFLPSPLEKANAILRALRDPKEKEKTTLDEDDIDSEVSDNEDDQFDMSTDDKSSTSTDIHKGIWKKEEVNKWETVKKESVVKNVKKPVMKEDKNFIPPLRDGGSINVGFTYRAFPTPSRESKHNEEQEWLKKQKEARKKTGFVAEDLRPEENDPIWLLEKGKSFHNANNYLGAISAFSHAIATWDRIPELYVARSNSQLCIGNFRRVLTDTSEALDILKPHVDSNAELRFQAHLNRGKALLELGKPKSAQADFVEALEIQPYCQEIHNLMDRAETDMEEEKKQPPKTPKDPGEVDKYLIEPEVLAD